MEITKRHISDLKFYKDNPRKIDAITLEKLKASILNFGFVEPLVINKKDEVIGGNQRLKALQELNVDEVECVIVDLPKSKEKALNIALNKITGTFDYTLLNAIIKEINSEDMALTGFSDTELELFDVEKELQEAIDNFNIEGDVNEDIRVVVHLSFSSVEKANEWLRENNFKEIKRGKTCLIMMD